MHRINRVHRVQANPDFGGSERQMHVRLEVSFESFEDDAFKSAFNSDVDVVVTLMD